MTPNMYTQSIGRLYVPRQYIIIILYRHIMYIYFIHLFIEFIKPAVYSTCTYLYNNYVKIKISLSYGYQILCLHHEGIRERGLQSRSIHNSST